MSDSAMKHTLSTTDLNGLTVSLEVSVPLSFFEPSGEALEQLCADHGLVGSAFAQALPQLSTQLVQVRSAVESALHESYTRCLKRKINESIKESAG